MIAVDTFTSIQSNIFSLWEFWFTINLSSSSCIFSTDRDLASGDLGSSTRVNSSRYKGENNMVVILHNDYRAIAQQQKCSSKHCNESEWQINVQTTKDLLLIKPRFKWDYCPLKMEVDQKQPPKLKQSDINSKIFCKLYLTYITSDELIYVPTS